MTAPTAIVIGGGIAGLASAAFLARDGYRVTLVEGRDEVGGRAGSWEKDGFRFDLGPSWYLMPEVFDHFFRLLGTSAAEQLDLVRLPGYRVLFEGDPDPSTSATPARRTSTCSRASSPDPARRWPATSTPRRTSTRSRRSASSTRPSPTTGRC
ncbi:Dehydrosqualene desaturase [Clavibacter michiganensis subsp. michiganensis]|uniref:Dehydrosqualene desaturase n=1 Tax=Clavibacter michiganensis subsp. michiganensis TaxID=33013 RepID=A0A251XLH3_CLAMM|nr:Dehydrosqualene desaturase [Clavibacter michiganensis subsp. michiganensis]OUE04334.1 Dehydrosqualene desaturase [Clavibacter michiganensis subsp. michiganensis]